jgi:hypothetical protein
MGVFRSICCRQNRFCLNQSLIPADNPASDKKGVPGSDVATEANPKLGGERFGARPCHGLRHCFIENRADHTSVDDAPEALPYGRWRPGCGDFGIILPVKSYLQSVWVFLPAGEAARLRAGLQPAR